MNMNWLEIVIAVLAAVGGTGGIFTIYTAGIKKKALKLENKNSDVDALRKIVDEAQEERRQLSELHEAYQKTTEAKIAKLEAKLELLEYKSSARLQTIYCAYQCKLPSSTDQCPVLASLKRLQESNQE